MSGDSTPSMPAPDPGISQAAGATEQTGNDWLNFAKSAYSDEQTRQAGIDSTANAVTQQQLGAATQDQDWANAAHTDYTTNVQPVEDQYLSQAAGYDTPEKEQEAAATAKSDVASAASQQQGTMQRQEAAEGVNPASGRWAGEDRAVGLGTAISEAGAENNARQQVKTTGLGLEANAIGLGNADNATAATDTGLATSAGTAAANTTNAANTQYIAGTNIENTGFQGAETGDTSAGNLLQSQYNSELQASEFQQQLSEQENASIFGGIGSLAGSLGAASLMAPAGTFTGANGIFAALSSKKFKTNKRPATGNLDAMSKIPVGRWNYKKGIADGGAAEHVGPYAEDFNKATGLGDGKTIPMQDALGLTMGAVNELAGKLDQVHKAIGLNQPLPQPDIPAAKKGAGAVKVKQVSVQGTKPPKMAVKKATATKAPQSPRLAQYRPLQRINPSQIKVA